MYEIHDLNYQSYFINSLSRLKRKKNSLGKGKLSFLTPKMVKIRNEFSKLHYALTLVWLCIKCSEATIAFDFDQIKQNLFSASRVSRDYKLTENDLVCLKELKSIEAGLNTNDEWALRRKY